LAERVSEYTSTKLVADPTKLKKFSESPFYKNDSFLTTEEGNMGIHEFVMEQRRVTDDKLVHVGVAILQHSKLMFLEFVQFLRDYLIPGSYKTVYCGESFVLNFFLNTRNFLDNQF
jgi:hypothetical protein